jgi:hypothetical protein
MVLRPDLYASPADRWSIVSLMARAMLRPLGILHPGFATTNPAWQAWANQDLSNLTEQQLAQYWASSPVLNGPWDVDNDGDGWPDSIWVDLGFPARPLPDGRYYKPLFAIHCVDLDSRLNLNAHGQLAQTEPAYYDPPDLVTQSFLDPNQPSAQGGSFQEVARPTSQPFTGSAAEVSATDRRKLTWWLYSSEAPPSYLILTEHVADEVAVFWPPAGSKADMAISQFCSLVVSLCRGQQG